MLDNLLLQYSPHATCNQPDSNPANLNIVMFHGCAFVLDVFISMSVVLWYDDKTRSANCG